MLLEAIFNFLLSGFTSLLSLVTVNFFESVQLPVSYVNLFFDFVNVAFWFLPLNVLPIFVLVPTIWGFRIFVALISGLLDTISKTPLIKHI